MPYIFCVYLNLHLHFASESPPTFERSLFSQSVSSTVIASRYVFNIHKRILHHSRASELDGGEGAMMSFVKT